MKLIFLDVDGVLNRHEAHENGYNGTHPECVAALNDLLAMAPDAKLVIISSWRYLVVTGQMTVQGFESMLLTHGLNCYGRVYGVTRSDEETCGGVKDWEYLKEHGAEVRAEQIFEYVRAANADLPPGAPAVTAVVLDDLELPLPNLVRTAPKVGLTRELAAEAAAMLGGG